MSDRRRGGSGPGTPLRRAVGACGAVTTFLALGFCSPVAHADLEDLLDPIITAATAGLDQAGSAFSAFSPDDLIAGADFGSFADPFGQIDQLVQNVSTQLDDQLRGLGADWPDSLLTGSFGEPDSHALTELPGSAAATDSTGTGGFLFGDGNTDVSHTGTADAADGSHTGTADTADATGAGGTAPEPAGNSGGEGDPTSGTSTGGGHTDSTTGTNGDHSGTGTNSSNSNSSPSMPRLSMPSSGGGGNGGGGNGGGGNGSPAKTRSSTSPSGTVAPPPLG